MAGEHEPVPAATRGRLTIAAVQPVVSDASVPAASPEAVAAPALFDSRIYLAAGVLALLALVAALYLARGFFVPLLIGILASYALHPLVD